MANRGWPGDGLAEKDDGMEDRWAAMLADDEIAVVEELRRLARDKAAIGVTLKELQTALNMTRYELQDAIRSLVYKRQARMVKGNVVLVGNVEH